MLQGSSHGQRFIRHDAAHVTPSPTRMTLTKLRRQLERVLDRHIPPRSRVALVDFPNHSNVGDSAIWLGELAYLSRRRATISYVCDASNYDRRRLARSLRGGIILLHGGGNFGDLWPKHHELRLQVIRDFPRHRIIQLPQSIHFQSSEWLDETRHVLECHPHLTLLVRDRASRALALKKFNVELNLCPDMAIQLEIPRPEVSGDEHRVLLLSRTDQERRDAGGIDAATLPATFRVEDWLEESPVRRAKAYARVHSKRHHFRWLPLPLHAHLVQTWAAEMARQRLERGIRQLNSARFVITDRLHAHVLCLLLNQPHVIVDNSYGKISSFHETWTADFPSVQQAESWPEAVELARAALAPSSSSSTLPRRRAA